MANPSKAHRPTAAAVAHRLEAPVWRFHAAVDRIDAGRRYAKAWLDQPVRATRKAHAMIGTGYALVAVNAGLVVILIGGHR